MVCRPSCRLKIEELAQERSRLEEDKKLLEAQLERLTLQVSLQDAPPRVLLDRRPRGLSRTCGLSPAEGTGRAAPSSWPSRPVRLLGFQPIFPTAGLRACGLSGVCIARVRVAGALLCVRSPAGVFCVAWVSLQAHLHLRQLWRWTAVYTVLIFSSSSFFLSFLNWSVVRNPQVRDHPDFGQAIDFCLDAY